MTKLATLLLASALAMPVLATPAAAQVGGVAVADPDGAVGNTKAWNTARTQIQTTYKAQIDQAEARNQQAQTQIRGLLTQVDTDKDGQISQAEQTAHPTQIQQIQAAQQAAQAEVARIAEPAERARAYAIEQLQAQLNTAVQNAIKARNVSMVISPQAVLVAQPNADITSAITAELDRLVPTVSITPPAGWQPGAARQGAAAAAGGAAPVTGTPPAATGRRNSGR